MVHASHDADSGKSSMSVMALGGGAGVMFSAVALDAASVAANERRAMIKWDDRNQVGQSIIAAFYPHCHL